MVDGQQKKTITVTFQKWDKLFLLLCHNDKSPYLFTSNTTDLLEFWFGWVASVIRDDPLLIAVSFLYICVSSTFLFITFISLPIISTFFFVAFIFLSQFWSPSDLVLSSARVSSHYDLLCSQSLYTAHSFCCLRNISFWSCLIVFCRIPLALTLSLSADLIQPVIAGWFCNMQLSDVRRVLGRMMMRIPLSLEPPEVIRQSCPMMESDSIAPGLSLWFYYVG